MLKKRGNGVSSVRHFTRIHGISPRHLVRLGLELSISITDLDRDTFLLRLEHGSLLLSHDLSLRHHTILTDGNRIYINHTRGTQTPWLIRINLSLMHSHSRLLSARTQARTQAL